MTRLVHTLKRPYWLAVVLAVIGVIVVSIPRQSASSQVVLQGDVLRPVSAPNFHLTDQFGYSVSLHQFSGHPVLITFLQSHCTTECPLTAETIRRTLAELGPAGRKLVVLAISADPEGDTHASVLKFSREHAMLHRWHYLTASRAALARVWRGYYLFVAPPNAPRSTKNTHTQATYLLDGKGRERVLIVGDPDLATLANDIRILSGLPGDRTLNTRVPAPAVGHPAPAFALKTLSGRTIRLASLHSPVLLNFWATWCTACKSEMPLLSAWYRTHHGSVTLLGIDQQESASSVAAYVRKYHIPYTILLDSDGAVSARYNVSGLPTSLLVDSGGIVRAVHAGTLDGAFLRRAASL